MQILNLSLLYYNTVIDQKASEIRKVFWQVWSRAAFECYSTDKPIHLRPTYNTTCDLIKCYKRHGKKKSEHSQCILEKISCLLPFETNIKRANKETEFISRATLALGDAQAEPNEINKVSNQGINLILHKSKFLKMQMLCFILGI